MSQMSHPKRDDLPDPLTPPECNLRGLPFMPLECQRLMDSDTWGKTTPGEFKAAIGLWCKSWGQVPAGSIPNDDDILRKWLGMTPDEWAVDKSGAMRGFVLCSDGRWYHPVVCEKALEAMPGRHEFQAKRSASAERKARERQDRHDLFELLSRNGQTPDFNTPTSKLRELAAPYVTPTGVTSPPANPRQSSRSGHVTQKSRVTGVTPVTAIKGEGEGEREGKREGLHTEHSTAIAVLPPAAADGGGGFELVPDNPHPLAMPRRGRGPMPECPHAEILALWGEVLPELPQHSEWGEGRQGKLRARWREKAAALAWQDQAAGLQYFRRLFGYVKQSRFLMGKARPTKGNPPFQAELAWLLGPEIWQKLLEGFYHRDTQD